MDERGTSSRSLYRRGGSALDATRAVITVGIPERRPQLGVTMTRHAEQRGEVGESLRFWLDWVLANGIAEALGLTLVAFVSARYFQDAGAVLERWLGAILIVFVGTIQGAIVGVAQAMVLKRRVSGLRWSEWTAATAAGAFIAWSVGLLPSSMMAAGTTEAVPGAPGPATIYGYAALLGAVTGAILSSVQWLVLSAYTRNSGRWLAANIAAWFVGMPLVFVLAGARVSGPFGMEAYVALFVSLFAIGSVVGCIHGAVLTWGMQLVGER